MEKFDENYYKIKTASDSDQDFVMDYIWKLQHQDGSEQLLSPQDISDLSNITKDRRGHIKFKNHRKDTERKFSPGDVVKKDKIEAEVIDVDGELLCVQLKDGNIEVWNAKDIR